MQGETIMTPTPARAARADARQNLAALLDAARTVFARAGVDAPAREIAAEAGVGVGTLYRHFPNRAALVAAVFTTRRCRRHGRRRRRTPSSRAPRRSRRSGS
ncbi:helix-turn-helix domain-containing protein, partial [Microbacterium sp. B19]|uniref:helix-turn-helix domain-containing protein n=1 Tax=Microbacterium sp. B19 TaxID=96765 RepID=UPI00278C3111